MANINPIVDSLPKYVDETREELIAKTVLGAKSASYLTLYSGVKGETALNLIATDVVFGNGAECAFSPEGTATLSQRILKPAYLKVDMSFCDKNLLNTYAQHLVKIAAGQKTLPFEQDFVNGVIDGINEGLEKMIWTGDSANANEFDGLLKVLASAPTTGATGAYATIKEVYMAMPSEVASKSDAVIFCGMDTYRAYIQDLVQANLYHYNPENGANEYRLPGSDVKVIGVDGLNGTNKVVGARLSNLFYGCDLQGDKDTVDLWYSRDNKEVRLAVEFMAGVQVAYPNEVVVGTVA